MNLLIENVMKMKRNYWSYFLLSGLIAGLGACNDDNEVDVGIDENTIGTEVAMDAAFEDIDDIVTISMSATDGPNEGRIATGHDDRLACADVTHDKENHTITIDFGDGCEGPRGRVRAGIINIAYSGRRFLPGSVIITTFDNFSIDGIMIEGTRTVTNITETIEDLLGSPKFSITLVDGKMTWPDGTFATRSIDKVRTWVRAPNPLDDEHHIDGTANGINKEGVDYSMVITKTLVFKRRCRLEEIRVFIPVSGIKEITKGGQVYVVDFGDGHCDNIITVTHGDITVDIDLSGD